MVQRESAPLKAILDEMEKVIVGQRGLLERMLIALLTGGHLLLEGVPGLAKTLAIKTLGQTVGLEFSRIQFTPDLLPADLMGTLVYNPKTSEFFTRKGPVFAHLVLADEINRAPAKVQSALLEAMQEHQVTIGDKSHPLPDPFMVMATQNPIENEGTYPLPEAQVDRFLLKVLVSYPEREEEQRIVTRVTGGEGLESVQVVCSPQTLMQMKKACRMVYVDNRIRDYIVDLVHATRRPVQCELPALAPLIQYGASPRASIGLLEAARALAFIERRAFVTPEDVKRIGRDVLRHRIIPTYEAEAENIGPDDLVSMVFDGVRVP